MLDNRVVDYLESAILKSGEQLEFGPAIEMDASLIDINIIKQSKRRYRIVGLLTLAPQFLFKNGDIPPDYIQQLALTIRKKLELPDRSLSTLNWLEEGWILKEIRFHKDEKTVQSIHFRMGQRLYEYETARSVQQDQAMIQAYRAWQSDAQQFIESVDRKMIHSKSRMSAIEKMLEKIRYCAGQELSEVTHFPDKWRIAKQFKFLHFILATLQVSMEKEHFDWKEIGARYYQIIGGSKQFDAEKEDFIELWEEWSSHPVNIIGLTSLGKITPIFFSGQLTGLLSSYEAGPIHALTDSSIGEDFYSTEATTLWLVENRAILTRMAMEKDFVKNTKSLIICVDGQLRSAHKTCIQQLLTNSQIMQVLLWTDYDQAGLYIANEMYRTVLIDSTIDIKWITHDHQVIQQQQAYDEYMQSFIKLQQAEQEQFLGGASQWEMWIDR